MARGYLGGAEARVVRGVVGQAEVLEDLAADHLAAAAQVAGGNKNVDALASSALTTALFY